MAKQATNKKHYFTEEEIEDFKASSIPFPDICIEIEQHEVIRIVAVTSMRGMGDNNGVPLSIDFSEYRKNDKGEIVLRDVYTYKLESKKSKQKGVPGE